MQEKINRYPSIRSFETNEQQLFIGREKETQSLFNKTISEKLVLLFARSGIGKSSLLNAGLIPLLQKKGFLPINVRLNTNATSSLDSPVKILKDALALYENKFIVNQLPGAGKEAPASETPGSEAALNKLPLWEYIKCCSFPLGCTPVLIFDQFEQFFNFEISLQNEFLTQLNELVQEKIPLRIAEDAEDHNRPEKAKTELQYSFLQEQPTLKIVVAIRSDKIYEMNRTAQFLPEILKNRFELLPLAEEDAERAIKEPATINNPEVFESNWFKYDNKLIQEIIQSLKGGNDVIETTQLQIVCSQIENRIIKPNPALKARGKTPGYTVTSNDIAQIGGIQKIIDDFYGNQIALLKTAEEKELAKRLIEDKMYDKNTNNRKIVFENEVILIIETEKRKLGLFSLNSKNFINDLLNLRLIREDYREKKIFYEISHDYLLNAIGASFDSREAKRLIHENSELDISRRKAKRLANITIILFACFIIATVIGVIVLKQKNNKNRSLLSQVYTNEGEKKYRNGEQQFARYYWNLAEEISDTEINRSYIYGAFSGKSISVSKDGNYVVTQFMDNSAAIWKLVKDSIILKKQFPNHSVSFLPVQDILETTDTSGKSVYYFIANLNKPISFVKNGVKKDTLISKRISFQDSSYFCLADKKNLGIDPYFYPLPGKPPLTKTNRFLDSVYLSSVKKEKAEAKKRDKLLQKYLTKDYEPYSTGNIVTNVRSLDHSFTVVTIASSGYLVDLKSDTVFSLKKSIYPYSSSTSSSDTSISIAAEKELYHYARTSKKLTITPIKINTQDEILAFEQDKYIIYDKYRNEEDSDPSLVIYDITSGNKYTIGDFNLGRITNENLFLSGMDNDLYYIYNIRNRDLQLLDSQSVNIILSEDLRYTSVIKEDSILIIDNREYPVRIKARYPSSPYTYNRRPGFNGSSFFFSYQNRTFIYNCNTNELNTYNSEDLTLTNIYSNKFISYRIDNTSKYYKQQPAGAAMLILNFQDSTKNTPSYLQKAYCNYFKNQIGK
ncbi:nSTAND1 domain-containing NTPase [Filimonas effusa]|uniref:Novel STAND NTPase 1 domain-containing protein n=1 Tax=Filimonas effusa TaxID=2508721 RepID=A0A4Q1DC42_9BACT|nr:hypothetical protein [Filimonas effusa]RXK86385.1 hypothetical protein ESB13_06155 [Filimonas effusa]